MGKDVMCRALLMVRDGNVVFKHQRPQHVLLLSAKSLIFSLAFFSYFWQSAVKNFATIGIDPATRRALLAP
jgi:uncharacterized membrane protein